MTSKSSRDSNNKSTNNNKAKIKVLVSSILKRNSVSAQNKKDSIGIDEDLIENSENKVDDYISALRLSSAILNTIHLKSSSELFNDVC